LFENEAKARQKLRHQVSAFSRHTEGDFGSFVIKAGGVRANVRLRKESGGIRLKLSNQHNDPKALSNLKEVFQTFKEGSSYRLTAETSFNRRLASLADLKSAYLICTSKFGYNYASKEQLAPIRAQISNPHEEIFQVRYLNGCDLPASVLFLSEAFDFVALRTDDRVIAMPWPTVPLGQFSQSVDVDKPVSVKGRPFRFPRGFEAVVDHQRGGKPHIKG
jgi:hypothetical protein